MISGLRQDSASFDLQMIGVPWIAPRKLVTKVLPIQVRAPEDAVEFSEFSLEELVGFIRAIAFEYGHGNQMPRISKPGQTAHVGLDITGCVFYGSQNQYMVSHVLQRRNRRPSLRGQL